MFVGRLLESHREAWNSCPSRPVHKLNSWFPVLLISCLCSDGNTLSGLYLRSDRVNTLQRGVLSRRQPEAPRSELGVVRVQQGNEKALALMKAINFFFMRRVCATSARKFQQAGQGIMNNKSFLSFALLSAIVA